MRIGLQFNIRGLMKVVCLTLIILLISCTTPPRITYEGERNQEEKYHGKGVITYSNGEKWEGEFKDGEPYNGNGVYYYPDGAKYVGEFKDNTRNGQGTYTFPNGQKYVGEFKDGKYNGQGTYTWVSGQKYVGEFKDDKRNGMGTNTWVSGQKYVGEWKDDKRNGMGTLTLPDGSKYVGEWKDGKNNGQGTYTFPDGEKYVGEFKDGNRYGKGVLFKVNGEILSGTWEKTKFVNEWTIEAVDNFLRNKYPQFKGLNYTTPTTSISSQRNDVYLPPPPDKPTNIAVVNFNGNNISNGEVNALTDRLRVELFKTKYFKVIEREMMEEVLEEQGFQQSGCTTDECMVQIGRLIGVQKIIGGSISKVGNIYSVSSRIVNVETGEIEKTEVYDHTGNIGQLLTEGMRMVAIGLVQ